MKTFYRLLICFICIFGSFQEAHGNTPGVALVLRDNMVSGMFASFGTVLGALHLYETGQIQGFHIDMRSGPYVDEDRGPNWWEYYYLPIHLGSPDLPKHYCSAEDVANLAGIGFHLDRGYAYALIQKHIRIKLEFEHEIALYYAINFAPYFVIGIHHRGTDKVLEWPLVAYEKTTQCLLNVIGTLHNNQQAQLRIYVATDDQFFLNYLIGLFPSLVLYNSFVRSADGTPLHYSEHLFSSNYQKGREALLDCALLSKCHILIRPSSSCFSLIATFFNPYMPVYAIAP